MNVKEENICRLCLKVAEDDFEIIDESTKKLFEVILLTVNLDVSEDPIMCKICAKVVVKCFNFKLASIDTEEHLIPYTIDKKRATFQFKDVYRDGKDILETLDDNFVCRFCSNYLSGSNFVLLETLMKDVTFAEMLQVLMQMDFNIIKNPVICTTCREDLECYIKFVENCLDVEEKISTYCQSEGTPSSGQVKLSEILCFFNTNILELDHTQTRGIKQEEDTLEDIGENHSEVYNGELIKSEEEIDIKDEETAWGTSSDTPVYKLNTSCELKSQVGDTQEASIHHSSFALTMAEDRKCMCETIRDYCVKCEMQSNMVSSETGNAKPHQTNFKGDNNKKIYRMLITKNISKSIHQDIIKVEMYKCSMCNYQSKYKGSLKRHMLNHKDIMEVEMYKCSMCTYQTKQKGNLKKHILVHKDIAEKEMYKCSMCTYQTKQKGYLKKHILVHKEIAEMEMYKCSMCSYQAKHKSYLKSHMLIHKDITEVEMYKCLMCTYQTKQKGNLKKHMLMHKDIAEMEMYKCSMCKYETRHKRGLKSHMLIHKDITEVEMYKCSMCTYQTKQKSNLKKHMLTHKDIAETQMSKCSICTYQTKEKGNLKKHMLVHKDIVEMEMYKCSMCTYQTKQMGNLKKHMLIHKDITEVDTYKCAICPYQSKHKHSLNTHMLIHRDFAEVEMYKCSICAFQAKLKRGLKRHMLIHRDITEVDT